MGNKLNNKSSETIFWSVTHLIPLVWLVVYSNNICYVVLGYSTISTQCRLHIWGQSEDFSISNISVLVFAIPCSLVPSLFVGFSLPLLLFIPLIMLVGWMVHVHSIKFTLFIVLGTSIPILAISGNIIIWFIDSPRFNIFNSLNITLVGVPSFGVGAVLSYVTSFSLKYCKSL